MSFLREQTMLRQHFEQRVLNRVDLSQSHLIDKDLQLIDYYTKDGGS